MSIRLMASPPLQPKPNFYVATAEQYCDSGYINIFPSNADGTPASAWVLTFGRSTNWAGADLDSTVTMIFSHPSDVIATVKTALRTLTLGDLSGAERTRLTNVFAALGVPASDFTLATKLWIIVRRLVAWLQAQDNGFVSGINF